MLKIEFVVRPVNSEIIPQWIKDMFADNIVSSTLEKLIANIDLNWEGLKDGRIGKLFSDKSISVYVALAWLTDNEDEIVCDFEGLPVERYEEIINGRKMYKYVKKKLRITKIINKEREIFEVEGWIVDVDKDSVDPVNAVKVLEVYSRGKESGVRLENFLTKEVKADLRK